MFEFDILELNDELEIKKTGVKTIYNTDNKVSLSDWIKEIKIGKTMDFPQVSSALVIKDMDGYGRMTKDSFGYFLNNANNVNENSVNVSLFTTPAYKGHGVSVTKENFSRVINSFSVRKMITSTWINSKDEYLTPNEQHPEYEQFGYDSIVYSLFNNSSEQSSLRQVEYKDKLWDIKNEFFWLSVEHMKKLGDDNGFDELYNDSRTDVNRFVYKKLYGEEKVYDKLSVDARLVLDKANELVNKSINMRRLMANEQNHLHCWDAGYSQLKLVWKEYFSDDFKEFRTLYKNLEDRMRPLVYELGFLLK